jgi:hypothetical protein
MPSLRTSGVLAWLLPAALVAFLLVAVPLGVGSSAAPPGSDESLVVGAFSQGTPGGSMPNGWEPLTFAGIDRETGYRLVEADGVVVVRADSQASASGLTRAIEIDPLAWPVVEWRWRIEKVIAGSDVSRKAGDDYPVRLYIAFAYDPDRMGLFDRAGYEVLRLVYGEHPPHAALNYIWANKADVGSVVPNPYSSRSRMIVVESGNERAGEWQLERRDLAADYEQAFGEPPPRISGVAIMTDTDDTGGAATAWFGDIRFRARP